MTRSVSPGTGRIQRRPRVNSDAPPLGAFLAKSRAAIIVVEGGHEGLEFILDQHRVLVGRGPGVDLAIDDASLLGVQAALEFRHGAYHLRHLDHALSTHPDREARPTSRLKPNDRFQLGQLQFEYTVSPARTSGPLG